MEKRPGKIDRTRHGAPLWHEDRLSGQRTCYRCWTAEQKEVVLVKHGPKLQRNGSPSRIFSYWRCPRCRCIW